MSAASGTVIRSGMGNVRGLFRDRPIIPLIVLLAVLVIVMQLASPGIVKLSWAGVILRTAVPLAILGACQTLTMLTGGIDLSVGMIASMAAFIMATQTPLQGGIGRASCRERV